MDTFEKDFFELAQHPLHGVQPYKIGDPKPKTDLPFTLGVSVKTIPDFSMPTNPEWEFIDQGDRYKTHFAVNKVNNQWTLYVDCQGKGKFTYYDDEIQIEWVSGTGPDHYFQSIGLAIWLEMKGVICIHGNTLRSQKKNLLVHGKSGVGKTTFSVAAELKGFFTQTDDMTAIYVGKKNFTYPSWSKIRLWPETLHLLKREEIGKNRLVHSGFKKVTVDIKINVNEKILLEEIIKLERKMCLSPIKRLVKSQAISDFLSNSIVPPLSFLDQKSRFNKLVKIANNSKSYRFMFSPCYESLENNLSELLK